jgi:hypothetical protein
MDFSIRDALLQHGWKPEWFNETETIARTDSRAGIPCFVPFARKHRFFHWHRYISIRNFLGTKGTKVKFSSALSKDEHFLGNIDSDATSSHLTAAFPWDKFLLVELFEYPKSLFDMNYHYFGVIDEERKEKWKVRIVTLTWIRNVFIQLPRA